MNCVSVRPFFLAAAAVLATFRLFATVGLVQADDIRWTGNQSPGAYPVAQGSFHDGANWQYFAPPGPNDRAILGSGLVTDVNPTTSPRNVYFGDSIFIYPNTPNESFVPGGTATVGSLVAQSGSWTFNFGTFGSFPPSWEAVYGNLHASDALVVGADMQDFGNAPGNAELVMRGAGQASTRSFAIGYSADSTGRLVLRDGAELENSGLFGVGGIIGDFGNGTLVLDGPGVSLTTPIPDTGQLAIGKNPGAVGRLEVLNGATAETGYIGYLGAGGHGTALINGPGSRWDVTWGLWLGSGGSGTGEVTISNGGVVSLVGGGALGIFSPDTYGEMTITGSGSQFIATGGMHVGLDGQGQLTIANGGFASFVGSNIGAGADAEGTVEVRGNGSRIETQGIGVGENGRGTLLVRQAGQIDIDGHLTAGIASTGTGEIDVRAGASINMTGGIDIGQAGTATMNVSSGAQVSSRWGQIGMHQGSSGEVAISGADSQWNLSEFLSVGSSNNNNGGVGWLTLDDQSTMQIANQVLLGSQGTLQLITGGRMNVGQGDVGDVPANTLRVGPGGRLGGTGTILGDVLVDGGVVSPGFSPGKLDVVGNYLQGSFGSLDLEIGGLLPGQYDQLSVTGNLSLAGTVNIAFIDGFLPSVGDQFDFFQVGGTFDLSEATLQWNNVPAGFQYNSAFQDGLYSVHITAVPEPSSLVLALAGAALTAWTLRQRKQRTAV
ncbi:MAG: hypothetical protein KF708_05670 [Pirellulales bacterium]|nr:hypothetical protein [Pirellulales bacterium]